jgi:hypothetical protein
MTRKFKKGDVVELVNREGERQDITIGTHYTLARDEDTNEYGIGFISFHDDAGDSRRRNASDYKLVKAVDEAPVELKIQIDIPCIELTRVGDSVAVKITGKLSRHRVAAILALVYES